MGFKRTFNLVMWFAAIVMSAFSLMAVVVRSIPLGQANPLGPAMAIVVGLTCLFLMLFAAWRFRHIVSRPNWPRGD